MAPGGQERPGIDVATLLKILRVKQLYSVAGGNNGLVSA
jgi:hypothetical protein